MLNLTHRYAMQNMTRKRLDEVRKTNMTPSVLTYRGMKMTKDELLKVIRDALPCPYGTSVDVQIDDNGDVHIKMTLLKPHQPFSLEDAHLS